MLTEKIILSEKSGLHMFSAEFFAAQIYEEIRADLQEKGTPIDSADTLIAAHAKALNQTSDRGTYIDTIRCMR